MTPVSPAVLIVEDDALIALDLQQMVLELGCLVVGPAYDLEQGCAAVGETELDFALLDFDLGHGNSSVPIAEKLSARGIDYAFVTASDPSSIVEMFPKACVLSKPIFREDLEPLVSPLKG
jgi:AmiR/NasT family two-component response regulator